MKKKKIIEKNVYINYINIVIVNLNRMTTFKSDALKETSVNEKMWGLTLFYK